MRQLNFFSGMATHLLVRHVTATRRKVRGPFPSSSCADVTNEPVRHVADNKTQSARALSL